MRSEITCKINPDTYETLLGVGAISYRAPEAGNDLASLAS